MREKRRKREEKMEQMEQKMGSERGRDVVTKVSCNLESDEEELKIKIRFRK